MRRSLPLLPLLLTACTESGPPPSAPPPAHRGPNFEAAIALSPRFDAETSAVVMQVDLRPGFHVYTTGEKVGRPIALSLAEGGGWSAAAAPSYPEGEEKTTSLGTSVVVEGSSEARLPVALSGEAPGPVKASFRYQVCTETACDRPRTHDFELTPGS